MSKKFIITVDTEGDNLWNWRAGDSVSTENSRYIPRFQELCDKYGFKPVYLTNYEMACCDRFMDRAVEWQNNGACEIGVHLHAWNNPPSYPLRKTYEGQDYLIEYPEEIMRAKFDAVYSLIKSKTGNTPPLVSHRAGRWAMNGVYFNFEPGKLTFVATDAHKLVKYAVEREGDLTTAFILPKKPANLLKSVLLKEDDAIEVAFDSKNAQFKLKSHTLVCRLIEGNYPNYNAVIPTANPNKVLVDRIELVNGIKRVAVCSNPTTNLIRMDIGGNKINLTAQDIDFSVSANETISCSYDGDPVTIGFKSTFLVEILSNIDTPTVVVELADSTRAGVFKPVYDDKQSSDTLMLLMPMMINA